MVPYVTHLMAVAALVGEAGGDEDEAIAALLHDAVEDQGGPTTRTMIRERFGERVIAIVDECSDTDVDPKPPWRPRKEAFLAALETASSSAALVESADKLHNARCVLADLRFHGDRTWEKFTGGKTGSLWYYRTVTEVLRRAGGPPRLVNDLDAVVREIERLARSDAQE